MLWRSFAHLILGLLLLQTPTGQSAWEEKNRAGEKAFQEGQLAEASAFFTEALRNAQKFGPNDVRLAPIYNNLALIAFVQNNFIASETLYEKAIAVMEAQGQENPLLLPVLDNLTSLYVKEWAFGEAMRTSWRAYHIREKKFGPSNLETAAGLNRLAILYLDSVRLLPQSPSDESPPPEHATGIPPGMDSGSELEALSSSMENAVTLDDATKLAIAEWLFDRVLKVQEKVYGEENTRLVDVLENLGETLRAERKAGAAEEVYTRTITIVEKSFGPDDPKLANALQQMAELKTEDGDYADAERFYQWVLQINESKPAATDPSLSVVLLGYAALLEKMHKLEEAKNLTDRASSLAVPRTLNIAMVSASVPYILRFEKSVYDRYQAAQQTCILIRADGRFRVEEQQQEPTNSPITAPVLRPGGVGQRLADRSDAGSHAPRIFEGSLDAVAVQQLRAILSAKDIRDIQGSYPPHAAANNYNTENISASILRGDGVQNFAFPDTAARKPYEGGLKPLFKWLSTVEKSKRAAIKGATANNCPPDTPKPAPMQFSSSREKTAHNANTGVAAESSANQRPQEVSQERASTTKVHINLVLVRVVVHDAQGRALGTLRQEDFRLLDNGKPQLITSFSLEQPRTGVTAEPKVSNGTPDAVVGERVKTAAAVESSVAYLFDDIHLNAADLDQVRSAADRHLSSLQPAVRAAIFTSSGQTALDFTDDRAELHETLFRIQPHLVASSAANDCPDIDTYMADLIWNKHDKRAFDAATKDALACAYGGDAHFVKAAEVMAEGTAQQQIVSAAAQGRIVLGAFQTALRRLAATPGQHALVVVSPGFVLPGHEQDLSQLIDYALHSDVVINTLDARGLYQVESVAQRSTDSLQYRRESASANGEILATLAFATGGMLFQNSNDFAAGFSRVAEPPEYCYVLGFSPHDQELDGRFHNLKVTLNGAGKLTLQARKGYYARKQ
jgi:VWFA-related protein